MQKFFLLSSLLILLTTAMPVLAVDNVSNQTAMVNTTATVNATVAIAAVANESSNTVVAPSFIPAATYTSEVPVAGFDEAARQQAFGQALQQILIKVSGNAAIGDLPVVKTMLPNAANLVQSYSYTTHPGATAAQANFLVVQFDAKGIDGLVHQATQKVWSAKRPTTLLWITMVYGPMTKALINESSNDVAVTMLHKNAENFGMPIVFPTMDLQDSTRMSAAAVCNLNAINIKAASVRYGVDSILAGCIMKPILGNTWNSNWLLLNKNTKTQWATSGNGEEEVITQAMLSASQHLGSKPAAANELTPESVVLRITNVNGLTQYTDVVKYLRTLNPVSQVDVVNIDANELVVSVNCIGGQQALITALNAQSRLQPNTAAADAAHPGIDLDYKLTDVP